MPTHRLECLLRFVVNRLPGVARSGAQVPVYAGQWSTATATALTGTGPLWVVLGDSAAQGVGASAYDQGYVGQLRRRLEDRDGVSWRVVNLSRSGARTREVVDVQLPRLRELSAELPTEPALVTALIGGNDILHTPAAAWRAAVDALCAGLPAGAVVATVARGLRERKVRVVNDHIRAAAARHGLRVADLAAHTGPPYRGLYADGFHPNDAGYQRWTAALAEAIGLAD